MLKNPDAQVISLEIGDGTEPILEVPALAKDLSTFEGYNVYEAEQGVKQLRAQLASTFYANLGIEEDDIFVSGGAQSDIFRLQVLFGSDVKMAVQDPSYPAYVDSCVMVRKSSNIKYMKCTPENSFFPDLSEVPRTDITFFCSPNNLTGSAASREQLVELVKFAKDNGSIIVYDSAYAMYVSGGTPKAMHEAVGSYNQNTQIMVDTFTSLGFKVYGGIQAPYVWVHFPGRSSWDVFDEILERTHVVTTPGSEFGPAGEGFVRISAFGQRNNVLEACRRFEELFKAR